MSDPILDAVGVGGRILGDTESADWAVDLVEAYHDTVRR